MIVIDAETESNVVNTECCFNCKHARDNWCAVGDERYYDHMEPLYAEGKWSEKCTEYKGKREVIW